MSDSEVKEKGFDLRVTVRDEKTGQIIGKNPYILRVCGQGEGGKARYYERPAGSGNLWDKKGNPIGRWVRDEKSKRGKFVEGAAHVEWSASESQDQKVAREFASAQAELEALKAELAQIKAEQGKSAQAKKADKGS